MTDETINGTDAADTITFTTTSTTVNAGEGANTITGTSGDNEINSGDGADTIAVTSGNNKINAGGGANTIVATSGINVINTGDGADTITTGGLAGGGNTIDAGDGANTITTGAGDDTVTGGSDVDTITTGAGNDVVYAGNGANTITTGAGNDTVYSGVDADTITTGEGDDTIYIAGGTDTIAAGTGNDTVIADLSLAAAVVSINALAGTAAAGYAGNISGLGIATFAGVENFEITSGGFNDSITTGDGTDVVHAGAGSDTVNLAGGADEAIYTMAANTGESDVYQGAAGVDTLTMQFTKAEWLSAAVQADIANYQLFLADRTYNASGEADSAVFQFTAFDLSVREFEALNVIVDGVALDPIDVATNDVADLSEDDTATPFASVLSNDDAAALAYSVTLISGPSPSEGALTFNTGPDGAPDGSYSFDPNGDFEDLAAGETRDVSFVYEVQDAYRGPSQATVTITVTGTNDIPKVGLASLDAQFTEVADYALGEDTTMHSVDGSLAFLDIDSTDQHRVSVTPASGGFRGELTAIVADDTTGDGTGRIDWHFDVSDSALDSIGEGKIAIQTYTVEISDGHGGFVSRDVTITLNGANDAPVTVLDLAQATGGSTIAINVLANDTDVDNGDLLTITTVSAGLLGSASIVNGQLSYTAGTTSGIEYLSYTIEDQFGGTSTGTAMVVVAASGLASVFGSSAGESLFGGGADELIFGGLGDDNIDAGGGDDLIVWSVGDGDDTIDGGNGFDEVVIALADGPTTPVTVGADAFGNVIITGDGYSLTLDGIEDLTFSGGPAGANITVGDLSTTDIAPSTVTFIGDQGNGDASDDFFDGSAANRHLELFGHNGNDTLIGGNQNDLLSGGNGRDWLTGNAGNDTLNGGIGVDILDGGTGNDVYYVQNAGDVVIEFADSGVDHVIASGQNHYILSGNVESLMLAEAENGVVTTVNGDGNNLANTINGNALSNVLNGFDGNDTISGGPGRDFLYGGGGSDLLYGGDGYDVLDGGGYSGSADTLVGGGGGDDYVVHVGGEVIVEYQSGGLDKVASFAHSYTLSAHVENLTLRDSAGVTFGYGNSTDNTIIGNSISNHLDGMGGDDKLNGYGGDDFLFGNAGKDTLEGGDGNDTLDGGTGVDTLKGGFGNDTYYVDNPADVVDEYKGSGIDTVVASYTYTLRQDFLLRGETENLTMVGTDGSPHGRGFKGEGNSLDNVLTSNDYNHELHGLAGNDTLYGNGGKDTLYGGAGNDYLHGGSGADELYGGDDNDYLYGASGVDTLYGGSGDDTLDGGSHLEADILEGGAGNDVYQVHSGIEVVVENASSGYDTVYSNAHTYTMTANVEVLNLGEHPGVLYGTGIAGNQTINGNSLGNTLFGGGGNDVLNGLGGNDSLVADGLGSSTLNGGDGNDTLWGNWGGGTDTLSGGGGNDVLYAGGYDNSLSNLNAFYNLPRWTDILTGGGGADTFFIDAWASIAGPSSVIRITDFTHGVDKLDSSAGFFARSSYSLFSSPNPVQPGSSNTNGFINDWTNGIVEDYSVNSSGDVQFSLPNSNVDIILVGANYIDWNDFILG
jgi:Ca2+-binding RTX toxin-like protein